MHLTVPLRSVTEATDTGRLHYLHFGEALATLLITPLGALSATE